MSNSPAKKRLQPSDKREKILKVATKYFLDNGYEGCTLDLVAAKAKVGKQAIYQFFESKEHLYEEAVYAGLSQDDFGDLSFEKDIGGNIREYVEYLIKRNAMPEVFGMMRINIRAFDTSPALADKLHAMRRGGAVNLQTYLQELKSKGRLDLGNLNMEELPSRFGGVGTEGVRPYMGFGWPSADRRADHARWTEEFMLRRCDCSGGPLQKEDLLCHDLGARERPRSMRLPTARFDNLCATGLALFLADGFEGMSVDRLVDATSISRATIYRNFGDKSGFFRFIIEREIFRLMHTSFEVDTQDRMTLALEKLASKVLTSHLEAETLSTYRLMIAQSDRFPDLARIYYDAQIYRIYDALSNIYQTYRGIQPCSRCLTGFHTLATFGVRFLTNSVPVTPSQIQKLSADTAHIVALPLVAE